ncbi:Imm7 family immunity protein [Smaragdicoccus niigatensis]|uniref:Imm7 family immunity protein n=1 Tax=Smaragdicoccus niigatensis TaxID=359359 RepID=UPI0003998670|nr:Imm7 family immunity protein [Smaragdicoccus niigatensis]
MFEYHGWMTIRASAGDEKPAETATATALAEVELAQLRSGSGFVDLRTVNGSPQVHFGGLFNHGGGREGVVLSTFRRLGEVARGSYGLLYVRDDEDSSGRDNEFRVLIMRRGQVIEAKDSYLSPCIPLVEDEDS